LIGEMAKVFPRPLFQHRRDEVNGKEWDANPKDSAFHEGAWIKKQ